MAYGDWRVINPTEALSKSETASLLALVREHNLPVEALACHMTRQQGHGRGKGPEGSFTPVFNVSYSLMLCEYCGNLEPQEPACPAKLRALKQRLLSDNV